MTPQLVHAALGIVHRGHFNPAIFQPSWFAAQELIRPKEAESAEVEIIHPQAAMFNTDWLQLLVRQDRFQATTTQASYYEPLRDLVFGTLAILSHTPIRSLGINREFQFRYPSEPDWRRIGDRLAPKEDWQAFLKNPGLLSLTMKGVRPDGIDGYIQVKVEPSTKVEYGVYINVNDHYQLAIGEETPPGTQRAREIISSQWHNSMRQAEHIAATISQLGSPQ